MQLQDSSSSQKVLTPSPAPIPMGEQLRKKGGRKTQHSKESGGPPSCQMTVTVSTPPACHAQQLRPPRRDLDRAKTSTAAVWGLVYTRVLHSIGIANPEFSLGHTDQNMQPFFFFLWEKRKRDCPVTSAHYLRPVEINLYVLKVIQKIE